MNKKRMEQIMEEEQMKEEARSEGEMLKLISLVRIKMSKGKSELEIADALEEDEIFIYQIMKILDYNPEKSDLQIYRGYVHQLQLEGAE